MGNTSLTIVYHIKKKPKYRIVFEFLNLMTLVSTYPFLKEKSEDIWPSSDFFYFPQFHVIHLYDEQISCSFLYGIDKTPQVARTLDLPRLTDLLLSEGDSFDPNGSFPLQIFPFLLNSVLVAELLALAF
ncbi:Uncharacterised protein [Streptococcus pneumoniae]|nr:Uncharacterised protein [Streptococcus pneumoniae]